MKIENTVGISTQEESGFIRKPDFVLVGKDLENKSHLVTLNPKPTIIDMSPAFGHSPIINGYIIDYTQPTFGEDSSLEPPRLFAPALS